MRSQHNALSRGEHGISGGTMRKLLLTLVVVVGLAAGAPSAAQADPDPCASVTNKVECENKKPGTPEGQWQGGGAGDSSIQGYATAMSATPGETVKFKIKTSATRYHVDILRL